MKWVDKEERDAWFIIALLLWCAANKRPVPDWVAREAGKLIGSRK